MRRAVQQAHNIPQEVEEVDWDFHDGRCPLDCCQIPLVVVGVVHGTWVGLPWVEAYRGLLLVFLVGVVPHHQKNQVSVVVPTQLIS